ncbi:MAG: hypothetical protein M1812_001610 [Candelaria pacifica]|nr:MAG: hypothetical protein M1812_001610 [Candelaria pacifica]
MEEQLTFSGATSSHDRSTSPPSVQGASNGAHSTSPTAGKHAPQPKVRRRNRMITSCLECRRRKLKCDKSHPCTNCTKFARDCVFLAPALDSASQLRLTEIKEKMGSLEKVLEQDVARKGGPKKPVNGILPSEGGGESDDVPEAEDEKDLEPTPLAMADAAYDDDADDDLLDLGIQMGKMRLTDRLGGFFRPKMAEELDVTLKDKRNDHRTPEEKAASPEPHVPNFSRSQAWLSPGPSYIAPSSGFFFGTAGTNQTSLIDFLPSKTAADRLLQQYWVAVHYICRLVHKSTFERQYELFWTEISNGVEPPNSLQALVFAVLFSGVVSMPEENIRLDFGVPKANLVDNFRLGTETALARANFLRTTKVETLQAFTMYLVPLMRDQVSRAHAALTGTAIRMAECMGMHRDGTEYSLTPLETHVRRLIWFHLCFLDVRAAEAQGPRPAIRKEDYETHLPLNVDDSDLLAFPSPVKSFHRWTDMTFTLMKFECIEMHRTIWVDRPRLEKKNISLTAILGKIENFRKVMDAKYLPIINESIPIQRACRLVYSILLHRMHVMVLHRYHNSTSTRIPDRLRQIIITSGTQLIEDAIKLETDPALKPWTWYSGGWQQYHVCFLLLIEIFSYPMRREADRIWRCIDYVFDVPSEYTRDQKARFIITELRDKTGIYRDMRKVRAPTALEKRIGLTPPRRPGELPGQYNSLANDRIDPPTSPPIGLGAAASGEAFFPPPAHVGSPGSGSETSSSFRGSSQPGSISNESMKDDLMVDIDWNEWDKLFPPDINTGELNIPYP